MRSKLYINNHSGNWSDLEDCSLVVAGTSKRLHNEPAAFVVFNVRTHFARQLRISETVDVIILRPSKYMSASVIHLHSETSQSL